MKNLSLQTIGTTTFGLIALLMAGCCTKKLCLGADSMDHISFNNFDSKDLDTVVIYRFVKNSNFLNVVDSTTVISTNFSQGSFQMVMLPENLTIEQDYIVGLKSTGEQFKISNFVVSKQSCNSGFMCNDSYNSLDSYEVNGKLVSTYELAISK